MKEHPILFSGPMVRAILEGRKTQTRRLVKGFPGGVMVDQLSKTGFSDDHGYPIRRTWSIGSKLWVRETWQAWNNGPPEYPDDCDVWTGPGFDGDKPDIVEYRATSASVGPWRPSIFMPRWASRITLEITGVRVERLQDITEEDARAEGIEKWQPRVAFACLWDNINEKRAPWDSNPWVWVIEFRRVR